MKSKAMLTHISNPLRNGMKRMLKKVLTIAGSDCSGGAGIQADIKTITAHKMYAMSAVTALTAQNTTGVYGIMEAAPDFVGRQLDCIFDDIRPDAVKIGMVSNSEIIRVIAEKLEQHKAEKVVIDPVMISTSGSRLLNDDALDALLTKLLPMGTVITPNIPEAESLSGLRILTGVNAFGQQNMLRAAKIIYEKIGCAVLIKGGHLECSADDLLYDGTNSRWFPSERVDNPNTHGTGCTLSSSIACNLADGLSLEDSIDNAKAYLTGALKAMLDLGKGSGPLDHTWRLKYK
jgi:hydroxymethylpyrimidine/phosphomethylpyrimidine kinase